MTKLMLFLWRLEGLTHFRPFGWLGDWIEDNFPSKELVSDFLQVKQQILNGEYIILRTPEEVDAFMDNL